MSDTESALHALSEQLEKYCKDQPQSVTVSVLKAAQATLEVLAEHRAADPAEMALTIKAAICLHRPGEPDAQPKKQYLRKRNAAARLALAHSRNQPFDRSQGQGIGDARSDHAISHRDRVARRPVCVGQGEGTRANERASATDRT